MTFQFLKTTYLPHRLYALLEQMKVRVAAQFGWTQEVRVNSPKRLDAVKAANAAQVLIVSLCVCKFSWCPLGVPQIVLKLKLVVTYWQK